MHKKIFQHAPMPAKDTRKCDVRIKRIMGLSTRIIISFAEEKTLRINSEDIHAFYTQESLDNRDFSRGTRITREANIPHRKLTTGLDD